jgi:hypothetical protein
MQIFYFINVRVTRLGLQKIWGPIPSNSLHVLSSGPVSIECIHYDSNLISKCSKKCATYKPIGRPFGDKLVQVANDASRSRCIYVSHNS